jgi:hypothetical protein
MRCSLQIFLTLLLWLPAHSYSQEASGELKLPSPNDVGRALATICAGQSQGVVIGYAAIEAGRSEESVLKAIDQPSDARLKLIMRGVVKSIRDVYANREVGYFPLFFYRSEVCVRELLELRSLPGIEASVTGLLECKKNHGDERSSPLLWCIRSVVARVP